MSFGAVLGHPHLVAPQLAAAPGARVGASRVLAGASSWSDRSLQKDGSFYPSRSLRAAERLAYYASRLPLTEVATTYRFPPTPELSRRWAASVPAGFTFDLRAWSLLSGAPTWPESLWPDLQHHMRPSRREGAKLYRDRLPAEVVDECWARFRHSLAPLAEAGVLGAVIFRYPAWFSPRPAAWEELALLPERMAGFRVAVELVSERWFEGDGCEETLGFLEQLGVSFVCLAIMRPSSAYSAAPFAAAPSTAASSTAGPADARLNTKVVAATSDLALVRFITPTWAEPADGWAPGHPGVPEVRPESSVGSPAWAGSPSLWTGAGEQHRQPRHCRYSAAELSAWLPAVRELASCTSEVHLVMDNRFGADGVDNASRLLGLLDRQASAEAGLDDGLTPGRDP